MIPELIRNRFLRNRCRACKTQGVEGEQCECEFVGAGEAAGVLHCGKIPLLRYTDQMLEVLHLDPMNNTINGKPTAFIAISHVWADGLGNPRANALPSCQLSRLQKIVNGLDEDHGPPTPFWIDTMCVPVSPKEDRRLAISLLEKVYAKADKVIAMDARLLQLSRETPAFELSMRLYYSSWMQRLWTLQEAVFAKGRPVYLMLNTRLLFRLCQTES